MLPINCYLSTLRLLNTCTAYELICLLALTVRMDDVLLQ